MATSEVRTLTIKTGSVKRLAKELVMYREEENREQTKLEKMKAENADPYDIKHAVRWCWRPRIATHPACLTSLFYRKTSFLNPLQWFVTHTNV